MNKERYDKLHEKASGEERERLEVLWEACGELLEAYRKDHSRANLSNWQDTADALARLGSELEEKYFSGVPAFKNLFEALVWMQAEGYKIKKTKLYGDAKAGLLAVQPDKSVRKSDVSDYILRAEIEKPGDGSGGVEKNYEEKHSLEMDKLRKTNEKLEWELARDQGKYLLKTDVRRESALKIAALEAGLKHLFRTKITDWLIMAGGNTKKAGMVLELVYGEMDGLLNEFGSMEEIGVVVSKGVNGER